MVAVRKAVTQPGEQATRGPGILSTRLATMPWVIGYGGPLRKKTPPSSRSRPMMGRISATAGVCSTAQCGWRKPILAEPTRTSHTRQSKSAIRGHEDRMAHRSSLLRVAMGWRGAISGAIHSLPEDQPPRPAPTQQQPRIVRESGATRWREVVTIAMPS